MDAPPTSTLSPQAEQLNLKGLSATDTAWLRTESRRTGESMGKIVARGLRALRPHEVGVKPSRPVRGSNLFDEDGGPPLPTSRFGFSFIDLFAGIGGFRIALQQLGGQCAFTSEWDRFSRQTYMHWFGDEPAGDIMEVDPKSIPDHDVLAAGFPCQPFSIAGVSKKRSLGQADGFRCKRQGNLFFRICDIVRIKRPPILLLENVKNLRSHDGGTTWKVIHKTLSEELGYAVYDQIVDAASWVPQHRERIFITCFDRKVFGSTPIDWRPVRPPPIRLKALADVLEPSPDARYTLTDHLWKYLRDYAEKHRAKGNGFGFGLIDPNASRASELVTRTLSARYYKDGSEILISQGKRKNPRRLTPLECARLMGFDDVVRAAEDIVVSDTQAYRQFGNAVVPPVVRAVASNALAVADSHRLRLTGGVAFKHMVKRHARASA